MVIKRMDEKGIVFNITRGSFVDGHGIRSTVFLKGCPLSCTWCCNPEGQAAVPELKYSEELCNGCGNCFDICRCGAISKATDMAGCPVIIDRAKCTNCMACIDVCYTEALGEFGRIYTVEELFGIVRKDAAYYDDSGGGVTIGGGEPTMQADFTLGIIRKCKENGINTAVDTCGYTIDEQGPTVLKEADFVLLDIKGMNPNKHLASTGASNEIIHKNLKLLDEIKKPVIIRLPIIPGINDSEEELEAVAAYLSEFKCIERVDIMAYHDYGIIKYRQLGKNYTLDAKPYPQERVHEIKSLFERYNLAAQIGG